MTYAKFQVHRMSKAISIGWGQGRILTEGNGTFLPHWCVSDQTPGHKSIGCQKSEHIMGLVEGRATLRWTPIESCESTGSLQGVFFYPQNSKNSKKGQNDLVHHKIENAMKTLMSNGMNGLVDISRHQSRSQRWRCQVGIHEGPQNVQRSTCIGVHKKNLKNDGKKMRKKS